MDIAKFGRKSFVSQNALAEILTAVRESGEVPQATSRSTVKRRRETAIEADTPYGPLLQTFEAEKADGTKVSLPFCSPAAFLYHASRTCPVMQKLLDCASQTENSFLRPWKIILYVDEISPGNQLKTTNRRKLQAFYWAVQEIGGLELTQEHSWNVLTCVRTEIANDLKGGWSHLFKQCVKLFFVETGNLESGIQVQVGGAMRMVCFQLGYFLADESAIKHAYENKGASGKMMCLFCQTTVAERYAPNVMGPLIKHTEHDCSKFCLHTDRTVWQTVDHLAARHAAGASKKDMEELEKKLGFNHWPGGPLLDIDLRSRLKPITHTCFDPMHVFFVAGVFHKEVTLLLNKLAVCRITHKVLHEWCSSFVWPHIHSSAAATAKHSFQKKKDVDADFKCSASEALALYPVLRSFLQNMDQDRITSELHPAILSFFCLCDVLDSLKYAATGSMTGATLRTKVEAHLAQFKVP